METRYTDQDTERAREAEANSAGQNTQRLATAGDPAPVAPPRRANNLAALALIAVGVVLLLGQTVPDEGPLMGGFVLLTIAACFLFFAFWKHIYGLLIPGSILAGLSLGVAFADVTHGVSVLWGLALGFIGITLLGPALFNVRSTWAIFPAVPLFAVGAIVAASQLPTFFVGGLIWLPLLLIGLGLFLGWRKRPARTGNS